MKPTRRNLLSQAAVAAVVTIPALPVLAATLDPHIARAAESARLKTITHEELYRGDIDDDDASAAAINDLDDLIVDMPAQTLAGVSKQLRFIMDGKCPGGPDYMEDRALRNALATVEKLAGGRADA